MTSYQFLNIATLDRVIERAAIVDAVGDTSHLEVYTLYPTHPAYEYFHFVQMSIEAMTRSVCALKSEEFPSGSHFGLSAHGFGMTFRVQMQGVIDLALEDTLPPLIHAPIDHRQHRGFHEEIAYALRPWLTYILRIGFIHLFERNLNAIRRHGGDAGQLAKLVRDSAAHGGKILTTQDRVTFRGFSFTKAQSKKVNLDEHFGFGDYLVLAICMFNAPKMGLQPFKLDP